MTFRMRIVRPGVFVTNDITRGSSKELLYTKKIVDVMNITVRQAIISVTTRLNRRVEIRVDSCAFHSTSSIAVVCESKQCGYTIWMGRIIPLLKFGIKWYEAYC